MFTYCRKLIQILRRFKKGKYVKRGSPSSYSCSKNQLYPRLMFTQMTEWFGSYITLTVVLIVRRERGSVNLRFTLQQNVMFALVSPRERTVVVHLPSHHVPLQKGKYVFYSCPKIYTYIKIIKARCHISIQLQRLPLPGRSAGV